MKVLAQLTNEADILLRQVNPGFIRAGRPSSKVFEPKRRDEGMLSIGLGARRPPREAHSFFCNIPKCKSVGVLAVTVGECSGVSLNAHEAPLVLAEDEIDDDAHGIIDFRGLDVTVCEERAIVLHRAAMERGYVFTPEAA